MNEYLQFLERKKHSVVDCGIEPNFIPDSMFDFQKHGIELKDSYFKQAILNLKQSDKRFKKVVQKLF